MISTSGHLISNFPEVRFHRTRIFIFIPYGFLINLVRMKTIKDNVSKVFLTSLGIECFQIITLSGTFQFSDIFYNVIGGIIGILISSGIYHNKQ